MTSELSCAPILIDCRWKCPCTCRASGWPRAATERPDLLPGIARGVRDAGADPPELVDLIVASSAASALLFSLRAASGLQGVPRRRAGPAQREVPREHRRRSIHRPRALSEPAPRLIKRGGRFRPPIRGRDWGGTTGAAAQATAVAGRGKRVTVTIVYHRGST